MYSLIKSLPFSWTQYAFMTNALLAVLMIAPVYALMGCMVVNNRLSFFSDALGHSTLTGIALGVAMGLNHPLVSAVLFAVVFGLIISEVKRAGKSSNDTTIMVCSSAATALGLAMLSRNGGFSKYSSYLIGDILSVSNQELVTLAVLLAVVILVLIPIYNGLLIISLNPQLAVSRRINTRLYENIFLILLAVTVAISINRVGLLILNSMLVLPAAAARNLAVNTRQYHIWALCIAVICSVTGLLISFYLNTAAGATIVIIMSFTFFLSLLPRVHMRRG